ncbi:kinase-like protein [Aspergillus sclerotiicarbonarius CBS 121057]|uniref:Kinase-like protein n=1 Tax=Aspergillus sclerotiicarbonarius (strain CBS 121057 / IBT 28362) TaxID=1448318 RepID=A0A319EME8_ASPSB|nr:kinase-like protein [Aspergillus sclerotiicarbonarius CBS 121057]
MSPTSTSTVPEVYTGQSGCKYRVERVLQEETSPPRQVYLAGSGDRKFILKYIHAVNYHYLEDINNRLRNSAEHVRLTQDRIPEKSMFVFEYLKDHLLHLAQKDLPIDTTKRILKDALLGLAELHDQDIVHTDIKADNILIDWEDHQEGISVRKVQIGDLEDAAHIPAGSDMIGKQAGNWMWRSPEAHASGPVNKPSDIFSFALVCICAVHKRVIFAVGDEELEEGVDPLAIVIERQISYFADEEGIDAFLKHLGDDNPWVRVFEVVRDGFGKDNPRRPFALWKGVDEDFKSLICAMTKFDPGKRITAREALAHKWFEGV